MSWSIFTAATQEGDSLKRVMEVRHFMVQYFRLAGRLAKWSNFMTNQLCGVEHVLFHAISQQVVEFD